MKEPQRIPREGGANQTAGYALVTVLLMVALMTVMIVGMFALVQDDRVRAHSYMEVGRSRFLTDMATQEVLAKIMDGSKVPWEGGKAIASYTAAPGLIEMRKYKEPLNKGYHKGKASWTIPMLGLAILLLSNTNIKTPATGHLRIR